MIALLEEMLMKIFPKLTTLENKVTGLENKAKELDPEKIAEKVQKTSEGWLTNTANKVVEEKTKSFSGRLDELERDLATANTQVGELATQVKTFISSTKETTKKVVQDVENILKGLKEKLAK